MLFAPQPPAASCQFLSSVELTLQHQVADTNDRVMHQAERLKAEGTTAATCEEQVQEIEHCITVFLRENEEQGSLSLAGIITSALCTLCRFNMSFILCFTVLFIQSEYRKIVSGALSIRGYIAKISGGISEAFKYHKYTKFAR